MKEITIEIKGKTDLLMNQFNVADAMAQKIGRSLTKRFEPKEEAEKSAYWSSGKKRELIIPARILFASLMSASSFHKIGKKSAKSILAGNIIIEPEEISLGTDKYEIDTRPVVIQRARVLKSRAKVKNWKANFKIVYNEDYIGEPIIIKKILEEAGMRVGLMDYRPSKGGPYGTFEVVSFEFD